MRSIGGGVVGDRTIIWRIDLAEGHLHFDADGKAWVGDEEVDSFLAESFREGELVRVTTGLFDGPGGSRTHEYYLESIDRWPSRPKPWPNPKPEVSTAGPELNSIWYRRGFSLP
jgi:hypothetical protein